MQEIFVERTRIFVKILPLVVFFVALKFLLNYLFNSSGILSLETSALMFCVSMLLIYAGSAFILQQNQNRIFIVQKIDFRILQLTEIVNNLNKTNGNIDLQGLVDKINQLSTKENNSVTELTKKCNSIKYDFSQFGNEKMYVECIKIMQNMENDLLQLNFLSDKNKTNAVYGLLFFVAIFTTILILFTNYKSDTAIALLVFFELVLLIYPFWLMK